ncbi:MAG: hypothetical protein SFT94_08580 [Pseudanabaenaceae cyanobacterium bins.68]|nr:hypothetical protein [Pseudanabaenaceae cyanobacterium bins.68]
MFGAKSFNSTAAAIATTLVQHRLELPAHSLPGLVQFILEQHQRMPDYLQLPLTLLTLGFNWTGLFYGGKMFINLSDRAQWVQVQAWQKSGFAPSRDLIRFYESLAVFYAYETQPCAHR